MISSKEDFRQEIGAKVQRLESLGNGEYRTFAASVTKTIKLCFDFLFSKKFF